MSDKRSRSRIWIVSVLALALAALACSAPSASGGGATVMPGTAITATVETTGAPTSGGETASLPTSGPSPVPQGPTATAGPSPTPEATTAPGQPAATKPVGGGTATFENISFYFSYDIINNWHVETVPSDPANSGAPQNWLIATHYEFTFPGYPITNKYQPPRIMIFPVSAWQNYNPEAVNRVAALQKLLADKPATFAANQSIPVLPVFNAQQDFRAHVSYLSFQSGSGVRFITQYDQAPIPVNNVELFYTFQGLTSDGKYYVSAFFPTTHPSLPADDQNAESIVGPDFAAYLDKTSKALDAASETSFNPGLNTFDIMMQSLKVK